MQEGINKVPVIIYMFNIDKLKRVSISISYNIWNNSTIVNSNRIHNRHSFLNQSLDNWL